jgi:hypothetical protein
MGEGQYFGRNLGNTTVVNGSIRSVTMPTRPGTANSMRSMRISPYAHPTHEMAASSMYDLSNVSHVRQDSYNSLKPFSSEANLRTNFANGSMTSLLAPGGYASRPSTPGGTPRNKPWVNPLDVHFVRAVPAPPKSPLANVKMGPSDDKAAEERASLFGANPEDVAQAIMTSVEQKEREKAKKDRESIGKVEKEREERERREREQEDRERLQKEREEKERERRAKQQEGEKQKAAAAAAAIRSPARGPPGHPPPSIAANGPPKGPIDRPMLQGQPDQRAGSRTGNRNGPMDRPVFQGQPDHRPGSRNGNQHRPADRPQFQGQTDFRPGSRNGQNERPRFQGQMEQRPGSRNGGHDRPAFQGQSDPRSGSKNGHHDRPIFQGNVDQRPGSRNGSRRDDPPNGPTNGLAPRPMNGGTRGPGPQHMNAPMHGHPRGPMPGPVNKPGNGLRPGPLMSDTSRSRDHQHGQNGFGPAALPSPPGSTPRSSDEQFGQQEGKPIIRNVQARRDTLTMNTPRRSSLSMTIEAFEKSLMDAQRAANGSRRGSDASSNYSVDDRSPPPAYPLPPAPHRRPSPPYTTAAPHSSESPIRRPMPGKGVQRPSPNEYGVAPVTRMSPESKPRPGAAASTTTSGYPVQGMTRRNGVDHSNSPPPQSPDASMEPAPLFRQPKWNNEPSGEVYAGDFSAPRPAPTPSPKPGLTLHFAGPPTPDSTHNWPLPSPVPTTSSDHAPQLKRTNLPPPLTFDFSPNGYSRDNAGPYTPPVRMPRSPGFLQEEPRPSTSGGLGIGVARGLSVRDARNAYGVDRRPDYGLKAPTGIADNFGTPLI